MSVEKNVYRLSEKPLNYIPHLYSSHMRRSLPRYVETLLKIIKYFLNVIMFELFRQTNNRVEEHFLHLSFGVLKTEVLLSL